MHGWRQPLSQTHYSMCWQTDKSRRRKEMTAMKWPCSGHQKGQLQIWGQNTFLIQNISLSYYLIIQLCKWKVLFFANTHQENNLRITAELKWCEKKFSMSRTTTVYFVLEFLLCIFSPRERGVIIPTPEPTTAAAWEIQSPKDCQGWPEIRI